MSKDQLVISSRKWSFCQCRRNCSKHWLQGFKKEVVVPGNPQAPEFVAAPTAPVENQQQLHKPQSLFAKKRQLPVVKTVAAPQAPEFVAAPTACNGRTSSSSSPRVCFSASSPPATQLLLEKRQSQFRAAPQAPQQAYQQPTQAAYQQAPYQGQPGQPYPAQPSQFGVAVGGYWNWFTFSFETSTVVKNQSS